MVFRVGDAGYEAQRASERAKATAQHQKMMDAQWNDVKKITGLQDSMRQEWYKAENGTSRIIPRELVNQYQQIKGRQYTAWSRPKGAEGPASFLRGLALTGLTSGFGNILGGMAGLGGGSAGGMTGVSAGSQASTPWYTSLANTLGSNFSVKPALANAALGGLKTYLTTGDLGKTGISAAMGGLGGGYSSAVSDYAGLGDTGSAMLESGIRGASGSAGLGAKNAAISGLMGATASGIDKSGIFDFGGENNDITAYDFGPGASGTAPPAGGDGWLSQILGKDFGGKELLGVGANIYSGIQGNNAYKKMAAAQQAANNKALALQAQMYGNTQSAMNPYLTSGAAANARLSGILGLGGGDSASMLAELQNTPGYQFALNQGLQAQNRSLGASGNLFSGRALKAAQDYGTNLANTTYNDAVTRYSNASNAGQQAAGTMGAYNQNYANAGSQLYGNQGDIQANSILGRSNNWNQSLANILGQAVGGALSSSTPSMGIPAGYQITTDKDGNPILVRA